MSYKKIGEHISVVDIRNNDLIEAPLLGVSVKKIFIPSIANTVGTNFKRYKIVKKNQFTYIPDTSRRGDKIGVAMLESHDIALVSQAYTVFEITDKNKLNPEYLMMWFRRPEFDRYARFKSHGSVREVFDWEEMCEVELPIPSIEKQNEIVKEYNTIVNRIELNETLNQKLEETAQALYKHWFVDFEFPNEEGEPYKSSGGEMVYCEEVDKDLPKGWRAKKLNDEFSISIGRTPPRNEKQWFTSNGKGVKWVSIKDFGENGSFIIKTAEELTKEAIKKFNIPIIQKGTTILSFKMSVGKIAITTQEMLSNEAIAHFKPKNKSLLSKEFLYCFLSLFNFDSLGTTSSIVNSINSKMIREMPIICPSSNMILEFNRIANLLFMYKLNIEKEIQTLKVLQSILLSKLTKLE